MCVVVEVQLYDVSGFCRFGFTVLLFLLRSLVSMNFNVVYIYTAEVCSLASTDGVVHQVSGVFVFFSQVYPTVARSLGMGFATSFSRIGGMIAPFIAQVCSALFLVRLTLPDTEVCVLQVLMSQSVILALSPFALACVVCAFGNLLLPIETKGRALLVRQAPVRPKTLVQPTLTCSSFVFLVAEFLTPRQTPLLCDFVILNNVSQHQLFV